MPQMGYDMDEGTLLRWLKSPGDEVERGEPIAEIETDKVNIEIEAFDSGVLARTLIGEGDTVPVGEIIAIIGDPGEEIEDVPEPETASANGREAEPEEAEEAEAEPEEAEAEAEPAPQPEPEQDETRPSVMETPSGERIRASPLVRRLAEEHSIDLAQIDGSGPHGRIVKRDVQPYVDGEIEVPTRPAPEEAPAPAEEEEERVVSEAPAPATERPAAELQELSRIRQTIGRRMQQSFRDAPHFFVTMSIDMGKAMELRDQVNAEIAEEDPASEVTVNDMVIKGVAVALRDFPVINSAFVEEKREIHERIDVNFAVAIEDGLISPFIPDTDHKSLGEIARATKDLVKRAREGGLKPDEYAGGTFTISNLGMFGVDHFTAVINPPQAAILAIGAAQTQPVWNAESEEFEPRLMMQVTLAADHRVTDGAETARFLRHLKGLLENPMRMIAG